MNRAPDLETKTAGTEHATGISLTGHAGASEHDRTEKNCALDEGGLIGVGPQLPSQDDRQIRSQIHLTSLDRVVKS